MIYLVACGAAKLAKPAPARTLYTSPLFRKSLELAELCATRVRGFGGVATTYVLSAKHGLVHPDAVLAPYDLSLSQLPNNERNEWGARIAAELLESHAHRVERVAPVALPRKRWREDERVVLYAGITYVEPMRRALSRLALDAARILDPMLGLIVGRRLAWLNREIYKTSANVTAPC